MWSTLNSILADSLVNSLNPHWVSFVLIPQTMVLMNPNTAETNLLCSLRSTFDYCYMCLREPTTMISGWLTLLWMESICFMSLPS